MANEIKKDLYNVNTPVIGSTISLDGNIDQTSNEDDLNIFNDESYVGSAEDGVILQYSNNEILTADSLNESTEEALIEMLESIVVTYEESFSKTKENNGIIAKAWDWVKNTTGIGAGSDKIQSKIDTLKKEIISLKENSSNLEDVYKDITGNDLTINELTAISTGKADFSNSEIIKSVSKYQQGQKQSVNIISSIGSALTVTGLIAAGIVAAPFTGGMSLGASLAAIGTLTAAGTASYMIPQVADGITEKDGYSAKEIAEDISNGVMSSAFTATGIGAGKAIGSSLASNAATQFGKTAAGLAASEATSVIIGDGIAVSNYLTEVAVNDEVDFSWEDLGKIAASATAGSLAAGATAYGTSSVLRPVLTSGTTAQSQVVGRLLTSGISGGSAGAAASAAAGSTNYLLSCAVNGEEINFEDWLDSTTENIASGTLTGFCAGIVFEAVQVAAGTPRPTGTKSVQKGTMDNGLEYTDYLDKDGNIIARDIKASDLSNYMKSQTSPPEGLIEYNSENTNQNTNTTARTVRISFSNIPETIQIDENTSVITGNKGNYYNIDGTIYDWAGNTQSFGSSIIDSKMYNNINNSNNALSNQAANTDYVVVDETGSIIQNTQNNVPSLIEGNNPITEATGELVIQADANTQLASMQYQSMENTLINAQANAAAGIAASSSVYTTNIVPLNQTEISASTGINSSLNIPAGEVSEATQLSGTDIKNLEYYKNGESYAKINNALRSVDISSKKVNEVVSTIDKAFETNGNILEKDTILYRGVIREYSWITDEFSSMFDNLKPGDQFTDLAYSSTSTNQKVAASPEYVGSKSADGRNTGYLLEIHASAGDKILNIEQMINDNGGKVLALNEQEALLNRNTTFRVREIIRNHNNHYDTIVLDIVDVPTFKTVEEARDYLLNLNTEDAKTVLESLGKLKSDEVNLDRLNTAIDVLNGGPASAKLRYYAGSIYEEYSSEDYTVDTMLEIYKALGIEPDGEITQDSNGIWHSKSEKLGVITGRAKGEDSVYSKLKNKMLKMGSDFPSNIEEAKLLIGDAQGTRLVINSTVEISSDAFEENKTIKSLLPNQSDRELFVKYLKGETEGIPEEQLIQFNDLRNIGLQELSNIQTQLFVDGLSKSIKAGDIRITEVHNYYGENGVPYLSETQLSEIDMAYDEWYKKTAEIADSEGSRYKKVSEITKKGEEKEYLLDTQTGGKFYSKLIIETKEKESGYTAAQFNLVNQYNQLEELQFRGTELDKLAEIEHIVYDIKSNKETVSGPEYDEVRQVIRKIQSSEKKDVNGKTAMDEYNEYFSSVYKSSRIAELGARAEKPDIYEDYPLLKELLSKDELSQITKEGLEALHKRIEDMKKQ